MKTSDVKLWLAVVVVGITNAALLYVMELVGVEVTAWLWNDLLDTDVNRWMVLPTAVALGLLLAALFQRFTVKRLQPPHADLLAEVTRAPASLSWVGVAMAIGGVSLLAGASLGPESSLLIASASVAAYVAKRQRLGSDKQLLAVVSIGALLVAFFASMVVALIPLLLLLRAAKKQGRTVQVRAVGFVLLGALSSYLAIELINRLTGETGGYGAIPTLPNFAVHDFAIAALLGFISGFLAFVLLSLINWSYTAAKRLETLVKPAGPYIVAAIFAAVLASIYILGGPTVQFSGSIGSVELLETSAQYGTMMLCVMLTAKLLAIAWSKGTGYWGGLVFPSIYIGVVLGLLVGHLAPALGGAGGMIGAMSGMMAAAIGSPLMAAIFIIAILPFGPLWVVAACAIVGTTLFSNLQKRLSAR